MLLSLIAGVTGSISNVLYRTTLKDGYDSFVSSWFLQLFRLVSSIILILYLKVTVTLQSVEILILLGLIESVGMYSYMKMHSMSSLSISTVIQRSRIIWTALLSIIFIGETFTTVQSVGLLILFIGVVAVTIGKSLRSDKGIQFAYISAVIFSITTILIKVLITSIHPVALVAGLSLPTVMLFPILKRDFKTRAKQFAKHKIFPKIGASFLNVCALFLSVYALSVGPVAKSSAIYQGMLSLSVFIGILFLGERENLVRKMIGSVLVIIGIVTIGYI